MKRLFLTLVFTLMLCMGVSADEVRVNERYLEGSQTYRYYLNDEYYFDSTAQLGGIVEDVIRISYNDYVGITLYKDGEATELNSGDYIYGTGEYTIVITDGRDSGRVNFLIQGFSMADYNFENDFYNYIDLSRSYDVSSRAYVFDMGGYITFSSSVPDYAVTDGEVLLNVPENDRLTATLTRNGEEVELRSGRAVSDEGHYVLSLLYDSDNSQPLEDVEDITMEDLDSITDEDMENVQVDDMSETDVLPSVANVSSYSFTIVKTPQNCLNYINPPLGYRIASVTLDGMGQTLDNEDCFRAEEDGRYRVLCTSRNGSEPNYTINIVKDTSQPYIRFDGLRADGIAPRELYLEKSDEESSLLVKRNGSLTEFEGDVIDSNGLYTITISDEAGNARSYMVNVNIPIRISLWIAVPLVLILGTGLVLYIRYMRRNIKIR